MSYITLKNIKKTYESNGIKIKALKNINLEINEGEFVTILGPSGSGKTTLLNILGGMDGITDGKIIIGSEEISELSSDELTIFRRENIGFVFQFYNLIPSLTVLENVELSKKLQASSSNPLKIIEQVGLSHRINHFPVELSGGEQQRVSIARALCKMPKLILCDEPTGALDSVTGQQILSLLKKYSNNGETVIVVTHNEKISEISDRVFYLKDGIIEKEVTNSSSKTVEEIDW